MKEEKIKVLALLPMELPKEIELDNTLEAMQKFVGGLIEYINNCLSEWDSSLDCNAKEILRRVLYFAQEAGDIRLLRYGEVDSSYDPDRDIVQKGGDFLLKGSLLKYLICEYAQGYSASAIISNLQSEHLLSEFSTAKKIRIDNGTYVDARLLTLKRSCLTEHEDSD